MTNANVAIPEIYTMTGTEHLSINGLNSVNTNSELPLGFTTGQSNAFSIRATQFSGFDADTKVYLRDNILNVEQELTDGTAYNFNSDIASTNTRFQILFKTSSLTTALNDVSNLSATIYKNEDNQIVVSCKDVLCNDAFVSVYNAVGQQLETKKVTGIFTKTDTEFASGVYIVTFHNGRKKQNGKSCN